MSHEITGLQQMGLKEKNAKKSYKLTVQLGATPGRIVPSPRVSLGGFAFLLAVTWMIDLSFQVCSTQSKLLGLHWSKQSWDPETGPGSSYWASKLAFNLVESPQSQIIQYPHKRHRLFKPNSWTGWKNEGKKNLQSFNPVLPQQVFCLACFYSQSWDLKFHPSLEIQNPFSTSAATLSAKRRRRDWWKPLTSDLHQVRSQPVGSS